MISASSQAYAQLQLEAGTYTSVVAHVDEIPVDAMVRLDYPGLFKLQSPTGGIKGTCVGCDIDVKKIQLSVWTYDPNAADGKGRLIYYIANSSSAHQDEFRVEPLKIATTCPSFLTDIDGDQIKIAAQCASVYAEGNCMETEPLTWAQWFFNKLQLLPTPIEPKCRVAYEKTTQPVIVALDIPDGSTVSEIKIPGVNHSQPINAADFFSQKFVKVYVNGSLKHTYSTNTSGAPHTIDLIMGDEVRFEVSGAGSEQVEIHGVPQTWLSQFSGEAQYYCSPSVKPGEFNPWIGFDSNVHGSAMRRYDQFTGFKIKVPGWTNNSWTWTAQRRMDAAKMSYTASHIWNKQKEVPGTEKKQRNNQKEGLNMEILRNWYKWSNRKTTFAHYNGPKYLLGMDPDEILYLNSQYPATTPTHPPAALLSPKELSNGQEEWQYVPKVEADIPSINWMVMAYRKHKEANTSSEVRSDFYNGYEIQDMGTDAEKPNGTGEGNNKAPGQVTLTIGGNAIKMRFNVAAPLSSDPGFYHIIQGTQWPTQGGQDVPYTLTHIDPGKIDGYILEYENVSPIGVVTRQTFELSNESQSIKDQVRESGKWTKDFDIEANSGYNTITAYYQHTPASERVMIGGKELMEIQLRFAGVPGNPNPGVTPLGINLNESRGEGGYIYVEDYRANSSGSFDYSRFNRYVKQAVTDYTFSVGQQVSFSTLDADPHTFIHSGTEWYLSERAQAKRIPADSVALYLHYSIGQNEHYTNKGNGRTWTHTWSTPGDYLLKIVYNAPAGSTNETNTNYLYHSIKVVDYQDNAKGLIEVEDLPNNLKEQLDLPAGTNWKIARVRNVNSVWKFKDGPRAVQDPGTGEANRFAKFNDYADSYNWKGSPGTETFSDLQNPSQVNTWVENYSNLDWFPHNWIRHYNGGLPSDVERSFFKSVSEATSDLDGLFPAPIEDWQIRLPWISTTSYHGPRTRTNFKVVYNMEEFFDNNTGAFSGSPNLPLHLAFWMPSDSQLNNEALYYDLYHRRAIIYDPAQVESLKVYNPDPNSTTTTFIAAYQPGVNGATSRTADLKKDLAIEQLEEKLQPGVIVYPNPASEWVIARVAVPEAGEVQVQMIDLQGNIVISLTNILDKGWNTLKIRNETLSSGVYLLHIKGTGLDDTKRVIIE